MLHIQTIGSGVWCGRRVLLSLTMRAIIRHYGLAIWLMRHFGCRECSEAMTLAFRNARTIK